MKKILVTGLFLFFILALFYNLGHLTFWQDEAENALLAKSILNTGLPYSMVDGKWITQFHGLESRSDMLWTFTPWLPFYLTAASFKLFGFSEWAGRLPFALASFFSALFLYLAVRQFKNKTWGLLTLFFYVTNTTVLIYSRQSKYYSLYLLGFSLVLYGCFKWQKSQKGFWPILIGFLICFHCNYLSATLALLPFGLCVPRRLFIKVLIGVAIFFGPFLFLSSFENRTSVVGHWPAIGLYFKKLGTELYYWNSQIFPLLLGIIFFWKRPPFFKWMGITILASLLFLPFLSSDVLRYNLHLIPIFCILLGFSIITAWEQKKIFGIFLFFLIFAKQDWIPLKNYYFEEIQDPNRILPSLLEKQIKPGEHVYLNHHQLPWQWYSDIPLAFIGDPAKTPIKNPPLKPEWTDIQKIDWWIGPTLVKSGNGPYLSKEEMIEVWKKEGSDYEATDSGVSVQNWDLNSPIRFGQFLSKFSKQKRTPEPIKLIHRIQKPR